MQINTAESSKQAALERELCAVDAALEAWRAECASVARDAASLGDEELEAKRAELTARLDAVESLLQSLPTSVVEPRTLSWLSTTLQE